MDAGHALLQSSPAHAPVALATAVAVAEAVACRCGVEASERIWRAADALWTHSIPTAQSKRLTLAAACAAASTLPPVHTLAAAAATAWDVAVAAPLRAVAEVSTITCTLSAEVEGTVELRGQVARFSQPPLWG